MNISRGYFAGFFRREGEIPQVLGRVEKAGWVRKAVVLTSVKALIWPFAASILGPKQSDEVVGLCYSLDSSFKGEETQQEEERRRTRGKSRLCCVEAETCCAQCAVVLRLC